MTLEKGDPGSLEEWETVVGDDFSLYYDSYSVDERVDSDSKVRGSQPPSEPRSPRISKHKCISKSKMYIQNFDRYD